MKRRAQRPSQARPSSRELGQAELPGARPDFGSFRQFVSTSIVDSSWINSWAFRSRELGPTSVHFDNLFRRRSLTHPGSIHGHFAPFSSVTKPFEAQQEARSTSLGDTPSESSVRRDRTLQEARNNQNQE